MREQLFLQIVNRSIDASIAMAAVLCVRLLLRPLPRKYSYALWGVVLFRLFFTGGALRSVVSLIPSRSIWRCAPRPPLPACRSLIKSSPRLCSPIGHPRLSA